MCWDSGKRLGGKVMAMQPGRHWSPRLLGAQFPVPSLTSSVTLGRLLNLFVFSFLICKMGKITVPTF